MIDEYLFGKMVIDGISHTSDVIIHPGGVLPGWRRKERHSLSEINLKDIRQTGVRGYPLAEKTRGRQTSSTVKAWGFSSRSIFLFFPCQYM